MMMDVAASLFRVEKVMLLLLLLLLSRTSCLLIDGCKSYLELQFANVGLVSFGD